MSKKSYGHSKNIENAKKLETDYDNIFARTYTGTKTDIYNIVNHIKTCNKKRLVITLVILYTMVSYTLYRLKNKCIMNKKKTFLGKDTVNYMSLIKYSTLYTVILFVLISILICNIKGLHKFKNYIFKNEDDCGMSMCNL